jgi:hypothetical protein
MKLQKRGTNTLSAEVTNISAHGFWVLVQEKEYFLDYEHNPWFRQATIDQLLNVRLLHRTHLFWPDLDVDLEVQSLDNPEHYPLLYH